MLAPDEVWEKRDGTASSEFPAQSGTHGLVPTTRVILPTRRYGKQKRKRTRFDLQKNKAEECKILPPIDIRYYLGQHAEGVLLRGFKCKINVDKKG